MGFWYKLMIIIVILAVIFMFFRLNRPSVTMLCDTSFNLAYPEEAFKDFKHAIAKAGYNFRIVTLTSQTLTDEQALNSLVSKYPDNDLVLTTPVVSLALQLAGIELSSMVKGLTVGMTAEPSSCFDIVLPADFESMPDGTYYTDAIGKEDVENLVYPDLAQSVIPLLKLDKENLAIAEGVMVYGVK